VSENDSDGRNRLIVDTDIVSYLLAERPAAQAYRSLLVGEVPAISLVTIGEILLGAYSANWSRRRIDAMRRTISDRYVVLPPDIDVAEEWGIVVATCRKEGIAVGNNDAWIAATATSFNYALLSNDRVFQRIAEVYPTLRLVGPAQSSG
jgi:predicted nucleic acid-binding protein